MELDKILESFSKNGKILRGKYSTTKIFDG